MPRYNPAAIEPKWQKFWEENQTFRTPDMPNGPKLYVLDMFPYPSGDGLHVGHPEGYTATDIVSRFERMRGKSVLHPMGFDSFGLPAEEHAIRTNTPPRESTDKNIANFRRQLKILGFSYDWSREVATTDVEYFRWTQWIFLTLFDTWFDREQQRGRPISELPIPNDVRQQGEGAVRRYQDEHRLAYQSDALVNWCPALGTVLANEEVIEGKSERGSHPVQRIPLRQWMLRITAYADRLERDLDTVHWSEGIKKLQRDWIGRSTGAEVDFYIGEAGKFASWKAERAKIGLPRKPSEDVLRIYTTRPDTLFGATYMVIAPEHPAVERLTTTEQQAAVHEYCAKAAAKSDLDRTDLAKEKSGVFTGSYAINPVNGQPIPIWIADYVLITYGTGAIMAVPAHDERDMEFAKTYHLPIRVVVVLSDPKYSPTFLELYEKHFGGDDYFELTQVFDETANSLRSRIASEFDISALDLVEVGGEVFLLWRVTGTVFPLGNIHSLGLQEALAYDGHAVNSTSRYNGLPTEQFKSEITRDLSAAGLGRQAVNYKLRDWLFSRQRFWGEPFPILHELDERGEPNGLLRAVPLEQLPVDLPHLDDYKPHGRPEPPLAKAPRGWLYVELDGKQYRRETNTMPQWAGSCWYFLRFIDPRNSQAFVDRAKEKAWMPVDLYIGGAEHAVLHLLYSRFWHKVLYDRGYVSTVEPFQRLVNQGMILGENNEKMSKSRGNVVNPDVIVREYGADSLRLYEMFMGPLEASKPWSMTNVNGVRGFLDRVWRLIVEEKAESLMLNAAVQDVTPTDEQNRVLHKTIKAVTADLESLGFNTAIARMMEFVNSFTPQSVRPTSVLEQFVLLLSPLAPHICEELWSILGHTQTLAYEPWPEFDEALTQDALLEIPVQVNSKLRGKILVPPDSANDVVLAAAKADDKVAPWLDGKQIVKEVVIPNRLVNFVVK